MADPLLLTAREMVAAAASRSHGADIAEGVPDRLPYGVGGKAEVHRPEGHVLLDGRGR